MKALAFLAASAFLGMTVPASADCECLANGRVFKHGEVACLTLPTGQMLAQCDMVLNNSSWKKLQDGCPEAALDGQPYPMSGLDELSPHWQPDTGSGKPRG
jgi:hypothetical protein